MEPIPSSVSNVVTTGADSSSQEIENTLASPIAKKSADEKVTGKIQMNFGEHFRSTDWSVFSLSIVAVFSPAPTLLELQQESLSQRLKTYKSLCSLPNAMTANRSDKKGKKCRHFPAPIYHLSSQMVRQNRFNFSICCIVPQTLWNQYHG